MSVDNFKPTIWTRELLYSLKKNMVSLSLTNQAYQGDISSQGDTVKIVSPGSINVTEYDGTEITFQQLDSSAQNLLIDQADSTQYTVDDVDQIQSSKDLVQSFMQEASYSLSDSADQYIFSLYSDADASNVISKEALTSANIYDKIVEAKKLLSKNNVPSQGRWIVLSPDEVALLETSDNFTSASNLGDKVKQTGIAGRISGFTVYESNNVGEANDGTDDVRHLPFGYDGAITYASQLMKMESGRHEALYGDYVKGLHVYGAKVVRPTALGDLQAIV